MENSTSVKVVINNPADIVVIAGYFVTVIGVGVWVRRSANTFVSFPEGCVDVVVLCFSPCLAPIVGRLEVISWQGAP